jgi:hypothetical protein
MYCVQVLVPISCYTKFAYIHTSSRNPFLHLFLKGHLKLCSAFWREMSVDRLGLNAYIFEEYFQCMSSCSCTCLHLSRIINKAN